MCLWGRTHKTHTGTQRSQFNLISRLKGMCYVSRVNYWCVIGCVCVSEVGHIRKDTHTHTGPEESLSPTSQAKSAVLCVWGEFLVLSGVFEGVCVSLCAGDQHVCGVWNDVSRVCCFL